MQGRAAKLVSTVTGALFLCSGAVGLSLSAPAGAAQGGDTWYAYAGAASSGLQACPLTTDLLSQCSLTDALADAGPGDVVALATPGALTEYVGNWTVSTPGTTASAPVTVEPAPGAAAPALGGSGQCSTATCTGPVITVGAGVNLTLAGTTIEGGDNTTSAQGGAVSNDQGGTLIVNGSTFTGNTATDGAAIDNGDNGGSGTLVVSGSTFVSNTATDGGAIDNADNGGSGTLTVTESTFSGDTATDGGATDNADNGGTGTLVVSGSTFTDVTATDGGAVDNGDHQGAGTAWLAGDLLDGSCDQGGGVWHDAGYDIAAGGTCLKGGPHDVSYGGSLSSYFGGLAYNDGGTTQTATLLVGSPAIAAIPFGTTVALNGAQTELCPATDQDGAPSTPERACDAGSVQTNQSPAGAPPTLTITAPSPVTTYGAPVPGLSPSYEGFVGSDSAASLTTPATCATTATPSSPPGVYPVTCSGAVDGAYTIAYAPGQLTVRKATLRVTAPSLSMTYGAAVPALGPSYQGFVAGGSVASLAATPTCATTATTTTPVGTYAVTCSGGWDADYMFSYTAGTLTVTPAHLTISAQGYTIAYGSAAPAFVPQYSGFVGTDSPSSLTSPATCTTTVTPTSPAGAYPVTCSGAADGNYTFNYVSGTLTVGSNHATVSAPTFSLTYGSSIPALVPAYSGFVGSDQPASLTAQATCTTTATATSPVGSYSVTCSGAVDGNYTFAYVAGKIWVGKAYLAVMAPSPVTTYGSALPSLAPTYSGFAAGNTVASLTGRPTCTTPATLTSPVGSYPVTCSGAVDGNYMVTYSPGTLTVGSAALTITAPSPSLVYGTTVPVLSPSYKGLAAYDSPGSLQVAPICTTTATAASPVGPYPVTCSGAQGPNYAITYVAGKLTVTPAPLKVVAPTLATTYGAALPALTPSYLGLAGNDSAGSLPTAPTCTTTATATSAVGAYPVTCSGAQGPNYTITYSAGSLTITPGHLTISAQGYTVAYGSALPKLTPVYSGFVGSDSQGSLLSPAICTADLPALTATATTTTTTTIATTTTSSTSKTSTTSATTTTTVPGGALPVAAVGSYTVGCSGAVDANYNITYVAGALAVGPAGATVSAPSFTVSYGSVIPPLVPVYSGFAGADSPGSLNSPAACATTATSTSPVGSYAVTCSGAVDGNYVFGYVAGKVTISKATLTVRAPARAMVFGSAVPKFTPRYSGFVAGNDKSSFAKPPVCKTKATIRSAVGSYPVTCSGAVDGNYAFEYVPGKLAVHKAALKVMAPNLKIVQGAPLPRLTPRYSKFAEGSSARSLTAPATCSARAGPKSSPGTYRVTCSGAVDTNYHFSYVAGALTITRPPRAAAAKKQVHPGKKK